MLGMLGFSSGGSPTGMNDVRNILNTVKTVDAQIARMRLEIANGTVANEGMAMRRVSLLERDNRQRKAWLTQHEATIKALERNSGPLTQHRDSFVTPDGLRHRGNRSAPTVSITDLRAQRRSAITPLIPPTPKVDPAKAIGKKSAVAPSAKLSKTTEAISLATQIAAEKKALMVKKAEYMKMEQECLKQGKVLEAERIRNRRLQEEYTAFREQAKKEATRKNAEVKAARERALKMRQLATEQAQKLTAARKAHEAEKEEAKRAPRFSIPQKTESRNQNVKTPSRPVVQKDAAPGGNQATDDRNRAAREAFWVNLQKQMGKTWSDLKRDSMQSPDQYVKSKTVSGKESRDYLLSMHSRGKKLVSDVLDLTTRWINGSISMTSAEFQAALGRLYQTYVSDVGRMTQREKAVQEANSRPKSIAQPKPGVIKVDPRVTTRAQQQDKLLLKDQRRNQLRNQRQFKAMGQAPTAGSSFPALRASMQGVLKR